VCRKDIRKHKLQSSQMIDNIVLMIVKNKKEIGQDDEYQKLVERLE